MTDAEHTEVDHLWTAFHIWASDEMPEFEMSNWRSWGPLWDAFLAGAAQVTQEMFA